MRRHFPTALLLSREPVAFGPTAEVLTPERLARARRLSEAFDEHAHECQIEELTVAVAPDVGTHPHTHDDGHGHTEGHGHAPVHPAAHAHPAPRPRRGLPRH